MRKIWILMMALCLTLPMLGACSTELQVIEPDTENTDTRPTAPDFSVPDREGKRVRLSELRGKPVVLNFWASWCGPCRSEMPELEDAYKTYGRDVHFLMVNLTDGESETVQSASSYVDGKGYTFPIYFDTESEAAVAYGVQSIPTTYFINAEGEAVSYAVGAIGADELERGIGMILSSDE